MVQAICPRCHKPVGLVAWSSADYVFHRKCAKAEEVYTPPRWKRHVLGQS